jgi:hypothetical protein
VPVEAANTEDRPPLSRRRAVRERSGRRDALCMTTSSPQVYIDEAIFNDAINSIRDQPDKVFSALMFSLVSDAA